MIRWVVTGPAGAGKSVLTAALVAHGAAALDGDRLGHEVLARPGIVAAVAQRFGADCVVGGAVDRRRLGEIVFTDPAALADLNALTHAPLAALMEKRLRALEADGTTPLAVLEAAVYFLLPSPPRADLVIVVDAPARIRYGRLRRGGLSAVQARARVLAQTAIMERLRRSPIRYRNVGTMDDVFGYADRLWNEYGPGRTQPKD